MFYMFASAVASWDDTGPSADADTMGGPSEEDAVTLTVVLMEQISCSCATEDRK